MDVSTTAPILAFMFMTLALVFLALGVAGILDWYGIISVSWLNKESKSSSTGSKAFSTAWVFFMLSVVVLGSLAIMVWLTSDATFEMTPAGHTLYNAADWTFKIFIGLILGFAGGRLAARS